MILDPALHFLRADGDDVLVREAKLGLFTDALSIHLGEILRMLVVIILRVHQRGEGVHERIVLDLPAQVAVEMMRLPVAAVVSRPGAESVVVISLEDYNAIMETEFVLQRPRLLESLMATEDDIAYGRVTAQQEGESIDELLDRVTCTE